MARFVFSKRIPQHIRNHCRHVVKTMEKEIGSTVGLTVKVVDSVVLKLSDGQMASGTFHKLHDSVKDATLTKIYIAGNLHQHPIAKLVAKADNISGLQLITETIVHELVHFEQFKHGRERTERGVEVRARNLCKKLKLI